MTKIGDYPVPSYKEFYDLVRTVRSAQKEYYRARKYRTDSSVREALDKALALEKRLDTVIINIELAKNEHGKQEEQNTEEIHLAP